MRKRRNCSRGFTLIELVIVIIVLGILAAVAVPKFVDMQKSAKESVTKASLEALRTASRLFYSKMALQGEARYPWSSSEFAGMLQGPIPVNQINGKSNIAFLNCPHISEMRDAEYNAMCGWVFLINPAYDDYGGVFAANNIRW